MAQNYTQSIMQLENNLLNQSVVATDATTTTVNGARNYIRNFSTNNTVVYHAMNSKSIDALKEIDFINKYSGTLLHDHETALYHFGTDHAERNVHIIHYLRKNSEETKNKWSDERITLLCEMNKARKELMEREIKSFSDEKLDEYKQKYYVLIEKGRTENKKTSQR